MKWSEIVFTALLLLAVIGLTLALGIEAKRRGRLGMYREGVVIGTVVGMQPADAEKRPDVLLVEDRSRPDWPEKVACEFFSKSKGLLAGIGNGQLVCVVGSIKSMESRNGGWFTHYVAFQLTPLDSYMEQQAQQVRKQHTDVRGGDDGNPF